MIDARRRRILVDAALLGLLALAAAAVATDAAVLRPIAVLLALLLVPGGALVTRLGAGDPASAVGLAVALSLAAETLLATLLAVTGLWEPWVLAAVLGGPAAAVLALDLRAARAVPGPARA